MRSRSFSTFAASPEPERILRSQCIALAIELIVALPLIIILVDRFGSSPTLTLLALCSLLAVFALARIGRGRFLGQLAAERRLARRDALTGLLNRRGFEEAASAEHARVLRGGDSAGLLLLDFDRFHWINSAYDYAGGDLVLRAISQRLLAELRTSDLVGRWGGEELVVLAPALDPAALGVLAEKLRRVVRDLPVRIGEQDVTVTCSVGGAMLDPAASFEVALQRANRALKRAKLERDTAIVDSTHESRRRAGLETQTDSLTGLLNHQAFARLVLPREIERAINTSTPLALLLIDLDDFKPINDLYGHQVGDQVLTGVADTISAVIGRDDLVFRTGGDEFAALLPLDQKQAEEAAGTILGAIARRTFASEEQMPTTVARIEATIGITRPRLRSPPGLQSGRHADRARPPDHRQQRRRRGEGAQTPTTRHQHHPEEMSQPRRPERIQPTQLTLCNQTQPSAFSTCGTTASVPSVSRS